MQVLSHPPSGWPALVLNADFRPLSYYPLSLWPWQDVIKAVFLERVDVVSTYDQMVHSPSFEMKLPSVIALKHFVPQDRPPAFTRFNLFLRAALPGRPHHLGEHRHRLRPLQPDQGRPHPGRGAHASVPQAQAAHRLRTAGPRPPLPAAPPA
jgi:5-methylcytosine-specific restriction endonuclease McrA